MPHLSLNPIRAVERLLVYPSPSTSTGDWSPKWIENEDVFFPSADGTELHGWFVPHPEPKHVILYSHGNNEHVGNQVNQLLRLQSMLDATVFVYDYRGYGKSKGRPTEKGLIADGLAAHEWLLKRTGMAADDVILMGRSLGGGISVAIAAERSAKAVVLHATFPRMVDAASYNYPWLPVKTLMRDRYDSLERIQRYEGPVFQSHRTTDEVVPVALARQLTDRAPGYLKQFFEIPSGRHNEPLPPDYYTALDKFLNRVERSHSFHNSDTQQLDDSSHVLQAN
ncbi:alpha/beta hydrolase [Aeoliella sp. ICT_H6.2]|uniref:Alpha/beta hydrolase n=1 Tax=Aeoliella straminimaris TaxID=2954799 RepID=A0A9X2FDT5_9BACT|nr:alpha/beta hydrolase [Aeoliella straminimaris]MCO6046794.1 alpha/beta hydrolase [Aeoliella straminimaris]